MSYEEGMELYKQTLLLIPFFLLYKYAIINGNINVSYQRNNLRFTTLYYQPPAPPPNRHVIIYFLSINLSKSILPLTQHLCLVIIFAWTNLHFLDVYWFADNHGYWFSVRQQPETILEINRDYIV